MCEEEKYCNNCVFYLYDSFYDEIWCKKYSRELYQNEADFCEDFESWELKEKARIKQQWLF